MAITSRSNGLTSICRMDGQGECFYTEALGKTFVASQPDLNGDGLIDYLIKDFTGAYGDHDVIHYLGFAACPDGGYVNVLDDFLTSAEALDPPRQGEWAQLEATRDCFDERSESYVSRRYVLSWNPAARKYGPPDGNPELSEYCTATEMARPGSR